MKELYICYDGVDGDITYHNTEDDAMKKLKELINSGVDGIEWMHGIEDSFVAKIIFKIDKTEIEKEPDDEILEDNDRYIDMAIRRIEA